MTKTLVLHNYVLLINFHRKINLKTVYSIITKNT